MRASETANGLVAARADLVRLYLQLYSGESEGAVDWSSAVVAATEAALPLFEAAGEEAGQTFAWRMRSGMYGAAMQMAKAAAAAQEVVEHARRASNLRAEVRGAIAYATTALYGPTPVEEAIQRSEELAERATADQHAVATINLLLAQLYAMRRTSTGRATFIGQARPSWWSCAPGSLLPPRPWMPHASKYAPAITPQPNSCGPTSMPSPP